MSSRHHRRARAGDRADTVFDRADEVELVDLPPDELLERLKEGKVYASCAGEAAVENFFPRAKLDLVGAVEHGIGQRSPARARRLMPPTTSFRLSRCWTLRAVYTSIPASKQLLDVVPALGVARARGVGVGELVDDDESRATLERGVEIELAQLRAAVLDRARGEDLEAPEKRCGIGALVRLDDADDDVHALARFARGEQHGVGLAHAGCRAEEDLQPAAPALASSRCTLASRASGSGRCSAIVAGSIGQSFAASLRNVEYQAERERKAAQDDK